MPDLPERSLLRIREKPHHRADRAGEAIIEVLRDGVVVATIYGTREGVQVVSERFTRDSKSLLIVPESENAHPSIVVPLLAAGELCPWCRGTGSLDVDGVAACALCGDSS